jgi:TonB-linked SusC/RagA family outer membrane protein
MRRTTDLGRRVVRRAFALSLFGAGAVLAQGSTRTVTGSVKDAESGQPIGAAQVAVKGTTRNAIGREDGAFTISVPAGAVTLVVRHIGFTIGEVNVSAEQTTVDVRMKRDIVNLEQVVVTGQASAVERRNLANSVASVSADQIASMPSASLQLALQGKAAGVQIQQNTGAPGGGDRVRLRGISSILGNTLPLYVIDGILVSDDAIPAGVNLVTKASGSAIAAATQEAPVDRIADIDLNDIESVEILKGAAAAAIYGSKASAGVIMITTKRGRAGSARFSSRTSAGTSKLAYKNQSRTFNSLADAQAAFGARTPEFWATAWNPNNHFDYEDLLLGNKGLSYEQSLNVSGGSNNTTYYASGVKHRDEGIVKNTFWDKSSLRLNVDQSLGPKVTLQLSSENLRSNSDRGLFGNDNNGSSVYYTMTKLPSFFDFRQKADGTYPFNPFYPSNPFATVDLFQNRETVFRSITTGRMQWEAMNTGTHQVRFVGVVGGDIFTQHNFVYSPPELQYEAQTAIPGTAVTSFSQNLQYNVNVNAVHVFTPNRWLRLTSQVGTQNEYKDQEISRESGQNLLGGLSVPTAGTVRGIDAAHTRVADFGVFVQTEMLIDERLMLTAGMRSDRSSNNGNISKFYTFPKFSGSLRLPNIKPGLLDELKLRAAYGETGNEPQYGQKFTTLNSSNIGGVGAFTLSSSLGSSIIAPERQRELETGIDATLLQSRLQLEVTGYQRSISNLLIQRTLAPTTGYSQEVYNGASMRVRGLETVVSGFPIRDMRGFTWDTRVNFALNRGIITDLPVPSFFLGAPQTGAAKIEQGKSPTQIFGNDTLPNGTVIQDKMGDGNPDFTLGFSNTIRRGGFSLAATLDRQHGGMAGAGTWRHYDLGQNSVDYDAPGPGGVKLGLWRTSYYQKYTRVYYQDVSFWKLRELTATIDVPRRLMVGALGRTDHAQLSFSAHNLKTWTKFRGTDPEFANFGAAATPSSVQVERELGAYPTSRSFWLQLSAGW